MTNTTELTKKEPSKKLQGAILNVVKSFQKTSESINKVFAIGREEGFNDIEIGNLVRKEMLIAGYNPRTIRRALPPTSKQIQKTRKDYSDEDKMSSSTTELYKHQKKEVLINTKENPVQYDSNATLAQTSSLASASNKETLLEENDLSHFQISIPANYV